MDIKKVINAWEIFRNNAVMPDREKVFDALRNCITEPKCKDCPWETCEEFHQTKTIPLDLCLDILKLLKEQDKQIKELELEKGWDESPDMMGKW